MLSLVKHARYCEDGLVTVHLAPFLEDPAFITAYKAGEATKSWHGMQLRWRVYTCCWAAKHALRVPGDFVECGVNRGGISRAIVNYVDLGALRDRRLFLLDTFRGDPDVADVNQNDYSECFEEVRMTFSEWSNVHLVRGRIPDTLHAVDSHAISYLSIDLNNSEPEIAALRFFWPRLSPGAIVILDDYAYSPAYEGQRRAMDALSKELCFSVMTLPTGQGLIVKS